MVQAKHLTKRYGAHTAVEDLSFEVAEGEICGLVGPNGAGKSTTMNMLTGYIAPSDGVVCVGGADLFEEPQAVKRQIGYLPEQPPLYPEMTPREYLRFAARLKGLKGRAGREEADHVIEQCGLKELENRLIRQLSKGYRQRVGLAQALLGSPRLLILDEPAAGLDPKQTVEMRRIILSLKKGRAILLSSHILSEVDAVCDRILVLAGGRLAASGSSEELSRMMEGQSRYYIRVKGPGDAVRRAVESVDGVKLESLREEDGETALCLTARGAEDPRAQLGYRLAAQRLPVLEIKKESAGLEEVFLQLTGKGE
ncbi:MAG: ABC transporter ATP-binding protein [Oscillospiraceae bacterium]|nr:ABC transporter ATP-binding protein [Oscillospiraceae bacterium]